MYGLTDFCLTIWLIIVYCLVASLGLEILLFFLTGGKNDKK